VPEDLYVTGVEREPLACGELYLLFNEVYSRYHLGYRVLNLYPRVHLHKIKMFVFVHKEFNRAHRNVVYGRRRVPGRFFPSCAGETRL